MAHKNLVNEKKKKPKPKKVLATPPAGKESSTENHWLLAKVRGQVISLHWRPNALKEKQPLVSGSAAVRDESEIRWTTALVQMAISVPVVFRVSLKMIPHCSLLNKKAGKKHGKAVIYWTQVYSNP